MLFAGGKGITIRLWFTQMYVYRWYIPVLIQLANVVELNPGPSHIVDCHKTVPVDFHQDAVMLLGRNAGIQCVAMCLTAVIYNYKRNACTWNRENVNEILLLGNSLLVS